MRVLALLLLLTGCHAHTGIHAGSATPAGGLEVHVGASGGLATVLGLSILAAGVYDYETSRTAAPQLAPDRRVSEQDCTRPIDHTLGNLRCR